MAHTYDHPQNIGHQPNQPDKNAELVKAFLFLLILFHQHQGCPQRVKQHKNDCQSTCNAMKPHAGLSSGSFFCDKTHDGSTCGVKDKAEPEDENMLFLQDMCLALRKNTYRIENKC